MCATVLPGGDDVQDGEVFVDEDRGGVFGSNNTVTTTGGYGNAAQNVLGNGNTVTQRGGEVNTATNFLGNGNSVSTAGGYGNLARIASATTTTSPLKAAMRTSPAIC
ncbi:MAG: hypothetical protein M3O32_18895 [Actinomycetota bacterium]|nr:hypothetical protein [Actinomycetota bacterium]